ncbi:MAG: hypothetical protein AMXMBFR7_53160 [Planctomycetota bacterium]
MPHALIDSSVLLDVLTEDPRWFEWSSGTLERYAESHLLAINAMVYAEVSIRFERIEELDAALPERLLQRLPIPMAAAFLAGKCFMKYRKRGGTRPTPLPDFFIGAHAAVEGMPLITRDAARYRTYFPKLHVVSPK